MKYNNNDLQNLRKSYHLADARFMRALEKVRAASDAGAPREKVRKLIDAYNRAADARTEAWACLRDYYIERGIW